MDRLLITGGAGYIGSHVAMHLLRKGYSLVVADTFERGNQMLDGIEYVRVDVGDTESMRDLCRRQRFDGVMHFAAYASVEESVRLPMLYYRNNTVGTLQMVSVLLEAGIRRLVFSSTAAVYGAVPEQIEEDHPLNPCNPYGASKKMVEDFLQRLSDDRLLEFVSLRYFNAAGVDPEGRIGEIHDPETHLIPNVFRAVLTGDPLPVYGDDYETPDGTCVRDFIHVLDLAEAHELAWQSLKKGRQSAIYNLGSEHGYSIREILQEAGKIAGKEVPVKVSPRRPGDPPSLVASSRRIRSELGWTPKFDLRKTLETAYAWEKKRTR